MPQAMHVLGVLRNPLAGDPSHHGESVSSCSLGLYEKDLRRKQGMVPFMRSSLLMLAGIDAPRKMSLAVDIAARI